MSNDGSRNLLRPEAGPVPFKKLQKRAQEALNRIIPALTESANSAMLAAAEVTGGEQTRSEIDIHRASRLFFVSGEPGSGKSTVYLTLRAMTSAEKRFEEYGEGYEPSKELDKLKVSVRWLEPLDLEVAGDERDNLLAAVLVRLFDALDRSAGILSKPCETAIKELEELATDIGIAWEGNLRKRAGALDPATYSEEVMLAQRARLGVNHRLRQALDKLAKGGCCGCDDDTLFVLPVEDLYLKPDASLQLLRLLRMISVPRLFFLLLGDIKTVEALFTEKSLADWTAVAGAKTFYAMPARLDEALARARELQARYLRKLLPPGQRAVIEAMAWDEAMEFEPKPLDDEAGDDTLAKLLAAAKLDCPPTGIDDCGDLRNFLVSPPYVPKEEDEKKRAAQEAYTGLQILDATPREIMDLWTALCRLTRKNETTTTDDRQLLQLVETFARLAIDEQSFLYEVEQETLRGVFPSRHYTVGAIDMSHLSLESDASPWIPKPQRGTSLWVRKHRAWKLAAKPRREIPEKDPEWFHKLPPRPTAWMILLHDLGWKWNPESVNGNLVEDLRRTLTEWAGSAEKADPPKADPPNDCQGWAVLEDGSNRKHLPMPDFKTFQELDRFLYVWNSALESLGKPENTEVKKLTDLWELAGWIVFNNRYEDFAKSGTDWLENQLMIFKDDSVVNKQSKDLNEINNDRQTSDGNDQPPSKRRVSRRKR